MVGGASGLALLFVELDKAQLLLAVGDEVFRSLQCEEDGLVVGRKDFAGADFGAA